MRPRSLLAVALTVVASGLSVAVASGGEVEVKVGISMPPPFVVAAPPPLVPVPGTPVYHVPSASFNLFVFGGRYYSFHNGTWFLAPGHNGPWAVVAPNKVPGPVLAVPATYYKIPPGQAKKMEKMGGPSAGPPGRGKGPKWKKDD